MLIQAINWRLRVDNTCIGLGLVCRYRSMHMVKVWKSEDTIPRWVRNNVSAHIQVWLSDAIPVTAINRRARLYAMSLQLKRRIDTTNGFTFSFFYSRILPSLSQNVRQRQWSIQYILSHRTQKHHLCCFLCCCALWCCQSRPFWKHWPVRNTIFYE